MEIRTGGKEYQLAMMVIHLQDALDTANANAKKIGHLGVLPQYGQPSFREASKFHARVRKLIKSL